MQAADPASTAAGGTDRSVDLRSIEGVLIDMDGTLIDSDASVERTWRTWAEANGVDPELVAAVCHGATAEGTIRRFRPDLDDAAVDADASEHMRLESIDTEGVVALDGAVEFLTTVEEFGLPWAVVTNADHGLATARLGAGGIAPGPHDGRGGARRQARPRDLPPRRPADRRADREVPRRRGQPCGHRRRGRRGRDRRRPAPGRGPPADRGSARADPGPARGSHLTAGRPGA